MGVTSQQIDECSGYPFLREALDAAVAVFNERPPLGEVGKHPQRLGSKPIEIPRENNGRQLSG
jgi:hypothetical protein